MILNESCSCGARLEADDLRTSSDQDAAQVILQDFRVGHRCSVPVAEVPKKSVPF